MSGDRYFDPELPTGVFQTGGDVKNTDPHEKFKSDIRNVFDGISSTAIDRLYSDFQNSSKILEDATNAYLDKPELYQMKHDQNDASTAVSKYFSKPSSRKKQNGSQMTLTGSWEGTKSLKDIELRQAPSTSSVYEKPVYKRRKTETSKTSGNSPKQKIKSTQIIQPVSKELVEEPNKWDKYIGTFNISCWCTRMVLSLKSIYSDNVLTLSKPDTRSSAKAVYVHHSPKDSSYRRELGRLNEESAEFIGPLIEKGSVEFKCKLFFVDGERLGTGDTFVIRVDCFLAERSFRKSLEPNFGNEEEEDFNEYYNKSKLSQKSSSEVEPETRNKSSLLKLFHGIGLQPAENEFNADDKNVDHTDDHQSFEELEINRGIELTESNEDEVGETEDSEGGKKMSLNQVKDLYKNSESNFVQELLPESFPPYFKLDLRSYQRQGLSWMLQREKDFDLVGLNNPDVTNDDKKEIIDNLKNIEKSMNPLWRQYDWPTVPDRISSYVPIETGTKFYLNLYDGSCSLTKPMIKSSCNGGILADEMGLGKTITTLSLILSSPRDMVYEIGTVRNYAYGTTLIIVPMALLLQWENEFKKCVNNKEFTCFIYYGQDSSIDLKQSLLGANPPTIVLTTYGMIQSEWSRTGGNSTNGIYSIKFLRVILDEGHTIRNRATKTSKAIYAIDSNRRWILTGTPIINRLEDLYSLINFLQLQPWCNYPLWKQCISMPFDLGKDIGTAMNLLKSILDPLLLRRSKNQKDSKGHYLVTLPSKEISIEKLKFNKKETVVYQWLKNKAVNSFNENYKSGLIFKNYSSILTQLLRLRQVCCDVELIKAQNESMDETNSKNDDDDEYNKVSSGVDNDVLSIVKRIEDEEKLQMYSDEDLAILKDEIYEIYPNFDLVECSICTESIDINTCVITECKHCFCRGCISEHFEYQHSHGVTEVPCPMCRFEITSYRLLMVVPTNTNKIELSAMTQQTRKDKDYIIRPYNPMGKSSKINALLIHLERIKVESPGEHVIVFSQFTSFLDLIHEQLAKYDGEFNIVKFDGRLTIDQRQAALDNFNIQSESKVTILLLSLKAGGVGLNLTVASRAFLMDPHWNNAIEHQAIDRIHRVGQVRDVKIVRFIMEDSIEERMLSIQERKNQLGEALTMNDEERRKRRIDELQSLFSD